MADLSTVYTFYNNKDAHAAFLQRLQAALVQKALEVRAEIEPDPMTPQFIARQGWARDVLYHPSFWGERMLPALAVKANDLGRIDDNGEIDASDAEIRGALANLIGPYSEYLPEA